jgi:preprotein translocase subunit SecG
MMTTLLLILHVTVCFALIAIVLVQGGKGADVGAAFGAGSSQTVFGARGGQSFLGKLTAGAAIVFMLTSLCLAYFYATPSYESIMPRQMKQTSPPPTADAPQTEGQPAAPEAPEGGVQPEDTAR